MNLADKNDVATMLEEAEREAVLKAHMHRPLETPLEIDGVRVCIDCEDTIPPERIKALPASVRCVYCQSDNDKQQMHRG